MDHEKGYEDQSYSQMAATNGKVDDFRKRVHTILKSRGWERHTSLQSALYHWEWTRGNHKVIVSGWHGTGKRGTCRHFGNSKSFFSMYHYEGHAKALKKIESPNGDPHLDALLAKQDEKMAEVIRYVQSLT